tara:strand:- start:94 stop:1164 length:1071 start_codon:yes stop_codon:yes gene_type:complete
MKNITKILLATFSSLLLVISTANAGEVALTGSAKASYSIGGADSSNGKGIGVSNELKVAASGEMDNGYTWNYHLDLDPGASGAMVQDDAALTINTNGLGTIGFFDGEGSLHSNLAWGIGALGTGSDYAGTMTINYGLDIDGETNIQYHTPADLLPFGTTFKVGYQPNKGDTTGGNDFKSTGGTNPLAAGGNQQTQYRIDLSPMDGLKLGADYAETDGATSAVAAVQEAESGAYYAQYAMGNFKVGYGKALYTLGISAKNGNVVEYDTTSYGVEMAVNDALSVSYTKEKSDAITAVAIAAGSSSNTKTVIEADITVMQVAYVVGGATLGINVTDTDNADYKEGKEEKVTMFSIAMAF